MKFVDPWILLAIPAVLLAGFAMMAAAEKRKKALLKRITGGNADTTLSRSRRWWRYALIMAALTLLIVAAARPYVRMVTLAAPDDSRDILVLFDVSKSMRAADLPPSRMEQAKYLLREIFNAFKNDRFGIIPFAGRAYLSCPLTSDHHALQIAADDLDTSSVPLGGTNLKSALQTAERAFESSQGNHRAIILLTDGDQLSGDALDAVKKLKAAGIPVVAVGFGSPDAAAPIPGDEGGVMHSASGEVAGSRLDEALLQKIASETGGIYLRSTVNDTGFAAVSGFLEKLDKAAVEKVSNGNPDDLFGYFIAAAALLLMLAGVLSECRRMVLVILCCGVLPLAAADETPGDPVGMYRQAVALQRAKDAGAEKIYGELIAGKDTPELIRGRALHNLAILDHSRARETMVKGRTALKSQNPDEALKEVEQAVKELNSGKELYSRAMEFREKDGAVSIRTGNYQQLLLDLAEAEKLKKQIEELKKQQQKAQNKTQQAQQQNQQQQNQQQQNQQQQNQQQQNQQQQNQQQQNQQKQQQQNQQQSAASQAAQEAEKLENQARDLGQQQMADDARQAAEKLKEADKLQQQGKPGEAQKKLDEAAEKLGAEPEKKADKEPEKDSGKPEKKADKEPEKDSGKPEKKSENTPKSDAERKLDLLDDEAEKLRDAIRRQRNMRRRPVEKDW